MGGGSSSQKSVEVTFNHFDPDGKYNPYSREQSDAIASAILKAPFGGKLQLPGHEDRFEIAWGSQAKGWKPASSGMYQRNITTGNKRAVEATEIDAWLEVYEKALNEDVTAKSPCRYWDKCYDRSPDHRRRFLHPEESVITESGRAVSKVRLAASELGGVSVATAYHTSVLVNGEEFAFSPAGISRARGMASHPPESKPQIVDIGVSTESGDRLFAVLKNHFRPGTYDLLFKNCNAFSDLALYFLLQQRLSLKYRVLERCGRSLPSLVKKISGGTYVANEDAADFDRDAVIQELDKILTRPLPLCQTTGCSKPTWNGMAGGKCSKACGIK